MGSEATSKARTPKRLTSLYAGDRVIRCDKPVSCVGPILVKTTRRGQGFGHGEDRVE